MEPDTPCFRIRLIATLVEFAGARLAGAPSASTGRDSSVRHPTHASIRLAVADYLTYLRHTKTHARLGVCCRAGDGVTAPSAAVASGSHTLMFVNLPWRTVSTRERERAPDGVSGAVGGDDP
jgi:hypothetical protein